MQRTFLTEIPEKLENYQVIIELPRYEIALARAFLRKDTTNYSKFSSDNEVVNISTTLNQIKTFVDELSNLDKDIDTNIRVPYTNYVGLSFSRTSEAVAWARSFVRRFFPGTEERFLKKILLNIPLDKTEIVWTGDEKYLSFVQRIATSPTAENLINAIDIEQPRAPLTREEASKLRAEISAKKKQK